MCNIFSIQPTMPQCKLAVRLGRIERFREMNHESYGVDTNVLINIQFITRLFDIGYSKILELSGRLLRLNDLDRLVENHSSYSLMKRIKGCLKINTHSDKPVI